jgi:hypothetical protein
MSLSDLEYSISLLEHGFATWIKFQRKWVVKQNDVKNNLLNGTSTVHSISLMEEEDPSALSLLYNHQTQIQQLWESYKYVYKLYKWPLQENYKREPFVWRELLIFHFCRFKFICKPIYSRIIMCYGTIQEVCHRLPLATNTLTRYQSQGQIATMKEFTRLAKQIVTSIHYLHTHGIIHGDIKPDNILVDGQNDIQLTDFGGARLVDLPQYGDTIGTIGFMSIQRMRDGKCSIADDIWSIGITLWYMIFGKTPSIAHIKQDKEDEEETPIECQFFWQRYKAGLLPLQKNYPYGSVEDHIWLDNVWKLCFLQEQTTTCDTLLSHMNIKTKIIPTVVRFIDYLPNVPWVDQSELLHDSILQKMSNHHLYIHYILNWIHEIQHTLYHQKVTYQRQHLIHQVIYMFFYIWIIDDDTTNQELENIDPILFHVLHLSRTPFDIWATSRKFIEYSKIT